MQHGSQAVSRQRLELVDVKGDKWLEVIKSRAVTFVSTDKLINRVKLDDRAKCKNKNYIEAALIMKLVRHLVECGVDSDAITVISPYLEQSNLITRHIENVKSLTIDKAQGIDCDVIIISCTKQTGEKGILLKDLRRLCVAITRAKKLLVIIGSE